MQLFLTWLCICMSLLETIDALQSKSLIEGGYNCNGHHITPKRLQAALNAFRAADKIKGKSRAARTKLSNYYDGPPFSKTYLLWPVNPDTDSYDEAMKEPFRIVFDKRSQKTFAVIIRYENVIECKLIESATSNHTPFDFKCLGAVVKLGGLIAAAREACQYLGRPATYKLPVRYTGESFAQNGLQRYLYPVKEAGKAWGENEAPGIYRVVLNAKCAVVGTIAYSGQNEYPCQIHQ